MWDGFGQSIQLFAVIEFDFRFTFENILKFVDNAHLNFQSVVKAFQLLVQLDSDVWKWIKKKIHKNFHYIISWLIWDCEKKIWEKHIVIPSSYYLIFYALLYYSIEHETLFLQHFESFVEILRWILSFSQESQAKQMLFHSLVCIIFREGVERVFNFKSWSQTCQKRGGEKWEEVWPQFPSYNSQ